ncbi:hypothetical protein [Bordetella sp. 15P40C-2]|uniref:hypothetical protein n=1 Tax=Bordetella sp. 15P40C-2 TaxID=2572246 RepID=UPI00132651D7|nr:hypothetical protein [Bordetella sp. 15P40C-2]
MSEQEQRNQQGMPGARAPEGSAKEKANEGKSRDENSRDTGRMGADEADYGRPRGARPETEPKGEPNEKGPQYEEGGRYPGTRDTAEGESVKSRSDDPGQSSYGGFKNEDPGFQRQQDNKS